MATTHLRTFRPSKRPNQPVLSPGGGTVDKDEFKRMIRIDLKVTVDELPDAAIAKLVKDLDDDGLINAVEFTFGLDPNAMQKEALVKTTQETIEGVIHAVYIYPALSGGSTTTVTLESNITPDAAGWTTLVNGVDGVIIESTAEAYVIKLPADPRQFNRLRIIENEI